jgi:hypothetical protein
VQQLLGVLASLEVLQGGVVDLLVVGLHLADDVPAGVDNLLELGVLTLQQLVEWPDAVLVDVLSQFLRRFSLAMAISFKSLNLLRQQPNFDGFKAGADAHEASTVLLLRHDPLTEQINELFDLLLAVDAVSPEGVQVLNDGVECAVPVAEGVGESKQLVDVHFIQT